jgi:ankyrin
VLKGNITQAKWFADRGADPRKPSGAHSPLRAATLHGHVHMVKWLVDELKVSPKEDNRALHLVVLSQSPSQELFLFLVDRGASPTAEDEKLGTPLTLALQQGHEDFAMWLVEKYQLRVDEQGTSLEKTTPLHKACHSCTPKMIDYLMGRGAQTTLHTLDAQRHSPLMVATEEKKVENVEHLLSKYKADPNQLADTSALFVAAQDGYLPTVKALLRHGANPSIWHPEMQVTPLHIAASNDHIFAVRELLAAGAAVDAVSGKGFTPLIMACSQGYVESTRALLEAGANVNYISPHDGATALHHAVTGGFVPCAKLLLSFKPDLTIQDKGQMTAAVCVEAMLEEKPGDAALGLLKNLFATLGVDERGKCARCFKALDVPKRCGKCKAVFYCSGECQAADWKGGHAKKCAAMVPANKKAEPAK